MRHLFKQILRPLEKCPNTWISFNEYNDENPQFFNLKLALKKMYNCIKFMGKWKEDTLSIKFSPRLSIFFKNLAFHMLLGLWAEFDHQMGSFVLFNLRILNMRSFSNLTINLVN